MAESARLAAALADRYRLERELGQGGMATVWLARDLKHQREVALKVLRPDLTAILGAGRFLHEIQITARLDHPHILTLIDSGEAEGFLYYVLPLVRGESLRQKLLREKQLGVEEALAITRQVAGALDYAHRQGVVHRDIKPENILLHEGEAVLTDFGIALAVKQAGGNRLTETGLSLGTPQYMSPEQATGDRELDARSDIYSLGAVLYEMLAGEPPHTGATVQAVIAKLLTERPTPLRVLRGTVPPAVDAAVTRALAKVPADRFSSASDFSRVLDSASRLAAQPSSRQPSTGRPWIWIAAGGAVALAAGIAAWMVRRGRPEILPPFTPQFEQLTTDGNARNPDLSPDGTRLAYVARECDARERCTDRLVVRDIGDAGSMTVLQGTNIMGARWAANGRFLIASLGVPGIGVSTVALSALGGTLWSLPVLGALVVGATDTALVGPGFRPPGDSVAWLRVVTVSDGVVRDSIAIRLPAFFQVGIPAPVGGRIILVSRAESGVALHLMDRSGRMTDSLPRMSNISGVWWTANAGAILMQVAAAGRPQFGEPALVPVPAVIVRRRVSDRGKFAGTADSLFELDPGTQFERLREDGSALLTRGSVESVVYALERTAFGRMDFRSRILASSTAGLQGVISRDGAMVWLKRGGAGPSSPRRDAFIPFEGGPERPIDLPPGDEISADWTRPQSTALLYALRDSSGRVRLIEIQVATGRWREVVELPALTPWVFSIPGGGYGVPELAANAARVRGRPGKPDTTWTVPAVAGRLLTVPGDMTGDGATILEYSQSGRGDTLWVRRIPLGPGVGSAAVPVRHDRWLGTFSDGSFESIWSDTAGLGWFRIPPGGSESVRLGDAPIQGASTTWTSSDDGRRFIVVKPVDRPDVFLVRNFGELLGR